MTRALAALGVVAFIAMLGWSGITAFSQPGRPLAMTAVEQSGRSRLAVPWNGPQMSPRQAPTQAEVVEPVRTATPAAQQPSATTNTRIPAASASDAQVILVNGEVWTGPTFDGRPIRPVRVRSILTTAYSPDARSCGKWADGITASGMSVWTNGMKLVAADRSIPFGTIVTIPGYNGERPVQVLDRGGKIKGNRMDLLYPTHDVALQWGAQRLDVTFWEYADE